MKRFIMFAVLIVAIAPLVFGAFPFDRTLTWTQSRTDTTGAAIPSGDSLVTHIYVCDNGTDNATCTEIGTSASNALTWSGVSTQPTASTKYYRLRTTWVQQNTMSAYSPSASFFLQGKTPVPAGAPVVQ